MKSNSDSGNDLPRFETVEQLQQWMARWEPPQTAEEWARRFESAEQIEQWLNRLGEHINAEFERLTTHSTRSAIPGVKHFRSRLRWGQQAEEWDRLEREEQERQGNPPLWSEDPAVRQKMYEAAKAYYEGGKPALREYLERARREYLERTRPK